MENLPSLSVTPLSVVPPDSGFRLRLALRTGSPVTWLRTWPCNVACSLAFSSAVCPTGEAGDGVGVCAAALKARNASSETGSSVAFMDLPSGDNSGYIACPLKSLLVSSNKRHGFGARATLQCRYMRFTLVAALCLCLLPAQEKPKTGLDKAAMEAYVRHLLAVMPSVQVKVDDPKPSPAPSLQQVDVHFVFGSQSQDETFFVTKDGQKIIRGFIYDITQNPFKADLDKLKTDLSPSFGSAAAPVTLVVFSDFQCPYCKEEAN